MCSHFKVLRPTESVSFLSRKLGAGEEGRIFSGSGVGLYLSNQAALGFHIQLDFMPLIVQEIFQLQEFEGAQAPLVPPEHSQFQFPCLKGKEEGHHLVCPRPRTLLLHTPSSPNLAHPLQLQGEALVPGVGATWLPGCLSHHCVIQLEHSANLTWNGRGMGEGQEMLQWEYISYTLLNIFYHIIFYHNILLCYLDKALQFYLSH